MTTVFFWGYTMAREWSYMYTP